jgi:hypothetical protein
LPTRALQGTVNVLAFNRSRHFKLSCSSVSSFLSAFRHLAWSLTGIWFEEVSEVRVREHLVRSTKNPFKKLYFIIVPSSRDTLTTIIVFYLGCLYLFLQLLSSILPYAVRYTYVLLNKEWTTIVFVCISFVLFRIRSTHRFLYGFMEFNIGIIAIWAALQAGQLTMPLNESAGIFLSKAITIVSGVYVIIRGLDNMSNKLPVRLHSAWDTFFPGARKS